MPDPPRAARTTRGPAPTLTAGVVLTPARTSAVVCRVVAGPVGLLAGELSLGTVERAGGHPVVPDYALTIVMLVLHGFAIGGAAIAADLVAVVAGFASILDTITAADQLGVHAAGIGVAAIGSAGVPVITVGRWTADAGARGASVTGGAGVAVVAGDAVVGVDAAEASIAAIIGADVVVVAASQACVHTLPRFTSISNRALVAVVAGGLIGRMHAEAIGTASIVGTWVPIVAV